MSGSKRCVREVLREKGWAVAWLPLGPHFAAPIGMHPKSDRYTVYPGVTPATEGQHMLADHGLSVVLVTTVLPTPEEAVELLGRHGMTSREARRRGYFPRIPEHEELR